MYAVDTATNNINTYDIAPPPSNTATILPENIGRVNSGLDEANSLLRTI